MNAVPAQYSLHALPDFPAFLVPFGVRIFGPRCRLNGGLTAIATDQQVGHSPMFMPYHHAASYCRVIRLIHVFHGATPLKQLMSFNYSTPRWFFSHACTPI